jgi:penicillin-binding protein 1A
MKLKLIIIFTILSVLFGGLAGGYIAVASKVPSIEELKKYNPSGGTRIYSDDDVLIAELKVEKGIFIPVDSIPKNMIDALVAVEDSRFWKHKGIDYIGIARALTKDIIHASFKEGGSTITQQLAKVVFLSPEKTIKRKMMEITLAIKIEKNLSKKEIMELYLNKVYFGHGAYGIEMAARKYFNKPAKQLNLAEASLLAGLVKAPSSYSPFNNLMKAKDRQLTVLSRMQDEGYISKAEKEKTYNQPLHLTSIKRGAEVNGYFTEHIRKYLEDKYGEDTIYKSGLKVYTTLNREMQQAAVTAIQTGLRDVDKRRGWRGPIEHIKDIDIEKELKTRELSTSVAIFPGDIYSGIVLKAGAKEALIKTRGVVGKLSVKDAQWASKLLDSREGKSKTLKNFDLTKILKPGDMVKVSIKSFQKQTLQLSLEQEPEAEAALVAVESFTGFVRAMVGGYDFTKSDYNRALLAKRQPGSSFKPIIYAAAMDNGFTPASIIIDEPVTYAGATEKGWSPENVDRKFYGPTRLREALIYSRNVVTVKLVDSIGIDTLTNFSRTLGFNGDMPRNLSMALGTFSMTPLELAQVYNVFASTGMKTKPVFIKYISDRQGRIVESSEPNPEQIISPQTAFLITTMMEDVVRHGTGWRAKSLGRPVAGKTGTSNDYKDAWFVGYTPELVASVWVGFDNFKSLGPQETGARAASPIWVSFMNSALKGEPAHFYSPEGVVSYYIDPETGLLSYDDSGIKEYFKEGTQPMQYTPSELKLRIWEITDPSILNLD